MWIRRIAEQPLRYADHAERSLLPLDPGPLLAGPVDARPLSPRPEGPSSTKSSTILSTAHGNHAREAKGDAPGARSGGVGVFVSDRAAMT